MRLTLLIFLLLLLPSRAEGEGLPLITNYSNETYNSHSQNWVIAQAPNGLLYFGNGSGVLEYDGSHWRLIKASNGTVVRSVAIDKQGTVYVGAKNELGYLQTDQRGKLRYVSLVDKLPEHMRSFADVWKIHILGRNVIFQTNKYIFRWDGSQFKAIRAEADTEEFHRSFKIGERLYISQPSIGLVEYIEERLIKLKGGDQMSGQRIFSILPYKKDRLLVATREKGLFIYNGEDFQPVAPATSALLVAKQVYNGIELQNGYAYATLRGGILVLDSECKIQRVIDNSHGLQDDSVKNLFVDHHGSLWVALNHGIDRIDISAPFTLYDQKLGLKGYVQDVTHHHGYLYAATLTGVYRLNSQKDRFEQIADINTQSWDLYSDEDVLMACTSEGLYQINGLKAVKVDSSGVYFKLIRSNSDPNRFYGGYSRGVALLSRRNGQWRVERYLKGIQSEVRSLVELANAIWICSNADGVFRAIPEADGYRVTSYTTAHGLPKNAGNSVVLFDGRPLFSTSRGLYSFDPETNRFVKDPLNSIHPSLAQDEIFSVVSDSEGNLLILKNGSIATSKDLEIDKSPLKPSKIVYARRLATGNYTWEERPFKLLRHENTSNSYHAYFENPQTIWLCSENALIKYSLNHAMEFKRDFKVLVRRVIAGKEHLIYDGSGQQPLPEIDYSKKRIRIECAALTYVQEQNTLFRYRLEGWEDEWSTPTNEPYRDYDLREGLYTLHVRAQDIFGNLSETSYSFRILPPWYRTLWAYVAYTLALIIVGYSTIRWWLRNLMYRNEQLERLVKERTAEIVAQKEEISRQKEMVERKVAELIASQREANRIFSALAEALPGTVLDGKYLLEEKIGKGGFGAVFRGKQLILKRPVAVKVFRPSSGNDSPEAVERFRREGMAACRVNHPNAVTIIDSGISSDGIAYLVMELLIGRTLSEELSLRRQLSLKRCCEILLPVCDALEHAHNNGLVHRDIKPDNIFLHIQNGIEVVKVVDFGIAKLLSNEATGHELTATGGIIGTPDYIAPERVEGKPYDGHSDVYSLGIVLFRMLTGCLPFQSPESSPIATMMSRLTKDPPAPSSINPFVPKEIDCLVLKALVRNPSERPTAKEFANLLSSITNSLPLAVQQQVNPTLATPDALHASSETETIEPTGTSTRILPT